MSVLNVSNKPSLPKPWLLGGWYHRGPIVRQQRLP